jgi:hypothetical protein
MQDNQLLVREMAEFVHDLSWWTVFSTMTFRWEASIPSATRVYQRFMKRAFPEVSYFAAIEENPGRDGHHIHALWDSCEAPRKAAHREWLKRYGRNRIEPCRGMRDVEGYCSKYVCKDRAWWWYQLSKQAWAACPLVRREAEIFSLSSQGACVGKVNTAQLETAVVELTG